MNISTQYLKSVQSLFEQYKSLGERAMIQVTDDQLNVCINEESNSIAILVKHLWGNMLSRWTDFLTTDGEKPWRERDAEFVNDITDRVEIMERWEAGWKCLFDALATLKPDDLNKTVFIRQQELTVMDAIGRQLTHYAYHVGQIVYLAKILDKQPWHTLSIARGQSKAFKP